MQYYYAQSHWYGEPLLHIPGWTEQKAHFFHEDLLQFETFESTPMVRGQLQLPTGL